MFTCAGNLKPENFPEYLGFLKGLEYRKGITEWIAHSVWPAVATLVLQVPGGPRCRGERVALGVFSLL